MGPNSPAPSKLPPDFTVHEVTREQFAYWRSHPATKAWRRFLADFVEDRKAAALEAVLTNALTPEMQVRIAAEVALLDQMSDPQFDVMGAFYSKVRPTQEEWDTTVAEAAEAGVEVNDPFAEEDEEND